MSTRRLFIGIGGGSGSGKSTFARRLQRALGEETVALLETDSYYRDYSNLSLKEREHLNFDHPDAIDWGRLLNDLRELRDGHAIEQPVYDYAQHSPSDATVRVEAKPVVVVEGIHGLTHPELRDMLDIRIFVDTEPDIRFIRRLRRDILDRDRSIDTVVEQYLETVRPMYVDHIAPSRRHAHIILPEGSCNELGVELVTEALAARARAAAEG
ncbi:MAG: uridine kinase [Armatimonadetes bacterium]|nr:uridine kinase [Armatimonadota bacterium]